MNAHIIPAEKVTPGMFLGISGKTRVHSTMTRNGRVVLAWRVRGSKAPGVTVKSEGETITVYTKENV